MTHHQHSPLPPGGPAPWHMLKRAASEVPVEDPQVRRMLASHTHCGQPMQLVPVRPEPRGETPEVGHDATLLTYRCTCGFAFDLRQN